MSRPILDKLADLARLLIATRNYRIVTQAQLNNVGSAV